MTDLRAYGGGVASCTCLQLPHSKDCPAAPFFEEEDRLSLDEEDVQIPFIIECPRGHSFLQTRHTLSYDYSPTEGTTEQMDLPLVCPDCGASDKQTLPVMVGYNPFEVTEHDPSIFEHFKVHCPVESCQAVFDRTDGAIDIWLEKAVVKGVVSMFIVAHGRDYLKGQVFAEFTELSITCPQCGHACGENED